MTTPIPDLEIMQRLLLAAALGGVIGAEREFRRKTAGLRTNILTTLGAAIFTIISISIGGSDAGRIAAQVVTGIGFLGAGAIMRTESGVHGLTTAATVWVNAALGMAAGAGHYHLAMIGGFITISVLLVLAPFERLLERHQPNGAIDRH